MEEIEEREVSEIMSTSGAVPPPIPPTSSPPMSGVPATSGALVPATSGALISPTSQPSPPPPMYAIPAEALTEFTNAIHGIQNQMALLNFQMTNMAQRLTAIDGRDLPTAAHLPQLPQPGFAALPASSAPVLSDATSAYTATPSAPMATTAAPRAPPTLAGQFGVPIT